MRKEPQILEKSCCAPSCCASEIEEKTAVNVVEMRDAEALKAIVREKYAEIAEGRASDCGCGTSCCGGETEKGSIAEFYDEKIMAESYAHLDGYVSDADLGLGCGLPTEFAQIQHGDVVVDLGSGAGNDAFVARNIVGESGKVIGLDMTASMIALAEKNAAKLGFTNVDFILGDIEAMPIPNETADVVVSNCVMNLVPDKAKAFSETYRILKKGGHFSISDIVVDGELTPKMREIAELYAGCVSGAITKKDYLETVENAGFTKITLQKDRQIQLPDTLLERYLSASEIADMKHNNVAVYSITVYAEKR